MGQHQLKEREFIDFLTDLDDGEVHLKLTAALPLVVDAARKAGKASSLTLKITCKPDGARTVQIHGDVAVKIPQPATGMTIFYADDRGNVSKNDPKQQPLRFPEKKETALRTVAATPEPTNDAPAKE